MTSIASGVRFVANQDGGVLLDIEADRFFSLNPSAAFIFDCFRQGRSEGEIVSLLASKTGADPALVAQDVPTFLFQLAKHGLIVLP